MYARLFDVVVIVSGAPSPDYASGKSQGGGFRITHAAAQVEGPGLLPGL
jgi:hypothetical protein